MKATSAIGTICMILLVWGGGCSKEEQPAQPVKRTKVVKSIKKSIKRPPIKKAKPKKTKQTKAKPKKKVASKVKTASLKEKASKTVIKKKECHQCSRWCNLCEAVCPTGAISCPFEIVIEGE